MRPRLVLAALVSVAAGVAAWIAPGAHAASYTPSSYAARVVALVNQAREEHGLPSLAVTSGTSDVAQSWTGHLASAQALSHNPDLAHDLETHGSGSWTAYGENVGEAPANDADALFQAYMNSPEHRANILSPDYRYVGVGVVFTGSTAWNTLDFVDAYRTAAARTTTARSTTTKATAPRTAPATTRIARHVAARPAAARPVRTVMRHIARVTPRSTPRRAPTRAPAVRPLVLTPKHLPATPVADGPQLVSFGVAVPVPGPHPTSPGGQLAVVIAAAAAGFVAVRWFAAVR